VSLARGQPNRMKITDTVLKDKLRGLIYSKEQKY
jgi:hypothetical protein